MKTPTDIFNSMQLMLAHIEDIKVARGITEPTGEVERSFGIKPVDVFTKTVEILALLKDVLARFSIDDVELPACPEAVTPREIFFNTSKGEQYLVKIKRRLGISDRASPVKATIRIAPSHVFAEAQRIIAELKLLQQSLTR